MKPYRRNQPVKSRLGEDWNSARSERFRDHVFCAGNDVIGSCRFVDRDLREGQHSRLADGSMYRRQSKIIPIRRVLIRLRRVRIGLQNGKYLVV